MVQVVMVQVVTVQAVEMPVEMPALRWEPCVEAHAADELGLCAGCGWPIDDHDGGPDAGHGAIVIRVPERLALRRAS